MNEGFPVLNTWLGETEREHDGFIQTCRLVLLPLSVSFCCLSIYTLNPSHHFQIHTSEVLMSVPLNENNAYRSELNGPDAVKDFFFSDWGLSLNVD